MGPTTALKVFQKGKLPLLSAENRDQTPQLSSPKPCRYPDRAIANRFPASGKHNYGLLMLAELEGKCFLQYHVIALKRDALLVNQSFTVI